MLEVIKTINSYLWGIPMPLIILGTHIYFTIYLRGIQKKVAKAIKLSVTPDDNAKGDISSFAALFCIFTLIASYGVGCFIIMFINRSYLLSAIILILRSAFVSTNLPAAVTGGFIGSTIGTATRYGIARGLFTNEAGLGSTAIATLIGWSYFGEKAVEYLFGKSGINTYRICYIVMIFVGSIMSLNLVWELTDLVNAFMAIPSIFCLFALRKNNYSLAQ